MDYILQYSIFILILSVLLGLSSFKLYQKMGYKGWEAFVPFYNYYIIQKEVGEPKWWVILAYLPIVGPIMMTVFHLFLMKKIWKDFSAGTNSYCVASFYLFGVFVLFSVE